MKFSWSRRLLLSLVPLVLVVGLVEGVSYAIYASMSRALPAEALKRARLPGRAVLGSFTEPLVVVCAGDSWTYGFGVNPEESYPAQLEQILQRELGDGLVVNLGDQGATPIRVSRSLTGYLYQARADVVVYLAGENTPENRVTLEDKQKPAPLRALRPYLRYLATYRLLSQVIARGRVLSDPYLQDWSHDSEKERLKTATRAELLAAGLESTRANMARMSDIAETAGAELIVLTYALPRELEGARGQEWFRFPEVNDIIRVAAQENGLPIVDMEARYRDEGRGSEMLYYGDSRLSERNVDLHPNAQGYRLYAESVAEWIVQRDKLGLLGRSK